MSPALRCVVLIVAAGSGTRLGAGIPKALVPLPGGATILEHCLQGVDPVSYTHLTLPTKA